MESIAFNEVWYLPGENTWEDFNFLAYRDKGILTLRGNSVIFRGMKGAIAINDIRRISFGKQGRDFVNNWIKIEYIEGDTAMTAFFADGRLRGWAGIFGGTKRIFEAIRLREQTSSSVSA